MQRTLLISLALVMAAIALAMGGVRGMHDGGVRFSAGILVLADEAGTTGMHDGGV